MFKAFRVHLFFSAKNERFYFFRTERKVFMNKNDARRVTLYEMVFNQELTRFDVRSIRCEDQGDAFVAVRGKFLDVCKVVEKENLKKVFCINNKYCMIAEADDRQLFAMRLMNAFESARFSAFKIIRDIHRAEERARRFKGNMDAGIDDASIRKAERLVDVLVGTGEIERPMTLRDGEKDGVVKGKADTTTMACELWFFPYKPNGELADEALRHWSLHPPIVGRKTEKAYLDFIISFIVKEGPPRRSEFARETPFFFF